MGERMSEKPGIRTRGAPPVEEAEPIEPVTADTHTEQAALRLAERLTATGVQDGDRVLLRGDNSRPLVLAALALLHLDTSLALVDQHATDEETQRIAAWVRARWVIADDPAGLRLPAGTSVIDLHRVAAEADRTAEAVPPGQRSPGRLSFERWSRRDDGLVMFSSGTTGRPKAVLKSGGSVLANCRRSMEVIDYRAEDRLLPLLPFTHQYGMSLVLIWWLTGCGLLVTSMRRPRPDRALEAAARYGVTVVDTTPPVIHTLVGLFDRHPDLLETAAPVRMWCVGGAPLPTPTAERFHSLTGLPLLDGYGSTEAGNIALATLADPVGVGRPLPGVEIRILGPDGTPVPAGTTGDIHVRTPDLMVSRLDADGTPVPQRERWYPTGDFGQLDSDGRLRVHGRRDAVHRNGHTLYPEELERRAETCGAPVKVIPVEHPRRGHDLVFFVADAAGATTAVWREKLCAALPAHEQPNRVVVLPGLPVTAIGKTDLPALRNLAAEHTAQRPERRKEHGDSFGGPAGPGRADVPGIRGAAEESPADPGLPVR